MKRDTMEVRELMCCPQGYIRLERRPENNGNTWVGQCPTCLGVWRISLTDPPAQAEAKP